MAILSKNPANGSINATFEDITDDVISLKIDIAQKTFQSWRKSDYKSREEMLCKLGDVLIENKEKIAHTITSEIGQPIKAVYGEIEKCAATAKYYEGKIEQFLKDEFVDTEASLSKVSYEPLGVIFGISPWNFPFWMAFRFIIPTIAAGNTVLLKHASNVPLSAMLIEEMMIKAGFPEGVMQTLLIGSSKVENIIKDSRIRGVSFAGSKGAGAKVAGLAGNNIKKSLLELGGSDPFIVFPDGDLMTCSKNLVDGRLRNAGQACNSPKRVFVHKDIFEMYVELVINRLKEVKMGDPIETDTEVGPISTEAGLKEVEEQVKDAISKGANLLLGGKKVEGDGLFFEPTIITNALPGMRIFDEEVFGPVISITAFSSEDEVIELANKSEYGLGASIWTSNIEMAKNMIPRIEAGNVFVNQAVRSDPRLPYGGIKNSGYGRELGSFGIKEFTNIKTVVIK